VCRTAQLGKITMAARTPSAARSAAPLTDAQVAAVVAKVAAFAETEATAHAYAVKDDGPMAGKPRPGVYFGGKIIVDGIKYQVGCNITPLNSK
jgi:hypothetical protein